MKKQAELSIELARKMYGGRDLELRAFALENYTEAELTAPPKPTAEERLIAMWCGCTPHLDAEFPESVFWMGKDGNVMFEQDFKNDCLRCSYALVWSVFQSEYRLQYTEIQALVKSVVEEHFKQKALTPRQLHLVGERPVEEHFKQKTLTKN